MQIGSRMIVTVAASSVIAAGLLCTEKPTAPTYVDSPNMDSIATIGRIYSDTIRTALYAQSITPYNVSFAWGGTAPSGMTLTDSVITWTPDSTHFGNQYDIAVKVMASGETAVLTWRIHVNSPPFFIRSDSAGLIIKSTEQNGFIIDSISVCVGEGYFLSFQAMDYDQGMGLSEDIDFNENLQLQALIVDAPPFLSVGQPGMARMYYKLPNYNSDTVFSKQLVLNVRPRPSDLGSMHACKIAAMDDMGALDTAWLHVSVNAQREMLSSQDHHRPRVNLLRSSGGNLYTVSTKVINGNDRDLYIKKTNRETEIMWSRIMGGIPNETLVSVSLDRDDGILIVCKSKVLKVDRHGSLSWEIASESVQKVLPRPTAGYMLLSRDGDLALLESDGRFGDEFYSSDDAGIKYMVDFLIEKNEGVVCCGVVHDSLKNDEVIVVGTDRTGEVLWSTEYGTNDKDVCLGITTIPEGYAVLSGSTTSSWDYRAAICLLDSAGDPMQIVQLDENCPITSFASTSEGDLLLSGWTTEDGGSRDFYIPVCIKTNRHGMIEWRKEFGSYYDSWDIPGDIVEVGNGNYVFAYTYRQDYKMYLKTVYFRE